MFRRPNDHDAISGLELGYTPGYGPWQPGIAKPPSPYGMLPGMGQMQGAFHPLAAPLPPGATFMAAGPGGSQAYQTAVGSIKRYLLPISNAAVAIATTATAQLQVNSQRAFRVERLILQSDETGGAIASACGVTQLDVGPTPQLAAQGFVPVPVFAAQAVFSAIRGDTAVPGKTIALGIQNPTGATVHISGAFVGESLDV